MPALADQRLERVEVDFLGDGELVVGGDLGTKVVADVVKCHLSGGG